jgi:hypothetical protein
MINKTKTATIFRTTVTSTCKTVNLLHHLKSWVLKLRNMLSCTTFQSVCILFLQVLWVHTIRERRNFSANRLHGDAELQAVQIATFCFVTTCTLVERNNSLETNVDFTFRVVLKPRTKFEHAITKTSYRVVWTQLIHL